MDFEHAREQRSTASRREQGRPQELPAGPRALTPAFLLELQRTGGNTAVGRLLRTTAPRPTAMVEEGDTGPVEGKPVEMDVEPEPTLEEGEKNEFGELDGPKESNVKPHVFVNGGKTGSAATHWAGGGGGRGNQGVGDITLVAPTYRGADPAAAGGQAKAWINEGTGTATVTRSYTGITVGANGTWYVTAAASARADVHEELHVASSSGFHTTHIEPLEQRVRQHRGEANARSSGATQADAIAALQRYIDWNTAVSDFRTADTAANTPGGTVDTTDQNSGTYIQDYGARAVGGTNYQHYADVPPGPAPAAAPGAGAGAGAGAGGGP